MPITYFPLNVDVSQVVGTPVKRARIEVKTNLPEKTVLAYGSAGQIAVPGGIYNLDGGIGSLTLPTKTGATNVSDWQYVITGEYSLDGVHPVMMDPIYIDAPTSTAAVNLADFIGVTSVPATFMGQAVAQLQAAGQASLAPTLAAKDQAVAAKEAAIAAQAQVEQILITDLGTTDGQTAALIGTPSSASAQALSATVATAVADERDRLRILGPLHRKLDAADTTPVNIAFIGDSKTEGQGASSVTKRWQNLAIDSLRTMYGVTGGLGYIPASTAVVGTPTDGAFAVTGDGGAGDGYGLGRRDFVLYNGGQALTYTAPCTSFDVLYAANAGATFTVTIDSGAPVTVTPASTEPGSKWSSGPLGAGTHTVVIGGAAGNSSHIEGAYFYNGDETHGIRGWDAAHSGVASPYFGDSAPLGWRTSLATVAPDAVVIALGTNDSVSVLPDAFEDAMQEIIDACRVASPGVTIILQEPEPRPVGSTLMAPWSQYQAKYVALAAANRALHWSLAAMGPADMDPLHSDGLHYSDAGNVWVADSFMSRVG